LKRTSMPQVGQRRIFADFFFAGIEGVPALGRLFNFMLQLQENCLRRLWSLL
jgi:hypothetical protein